MVPIKKVMRTVSKKGQVILPKAIRQQRDWPSGTRLIIEDTSDGVLLRRAPSFIPTKQVDVFGMRPHGGEPRTLDDRDAAILAEARRRHDSN